MKRLDAALVELRLAPTRSKAQQMIVAGEVEVLVGTEWKPITQASYDLKQVLAQNVRIRDGAETLKYVSRGGLKLEDAIAKTALDVRGWRALDIGISTGGFADCLLQLGCREVIGIDVGHAQLSPQLSTDPRVRLFEGVNIRQLPPAVHEAVRSGVELCVVDVSFISLQLVLPEIAKILTAGTPLLALVKPQFEVGAHFLNKNGIVQDPKQFERVKTDILRGLEKCGFSLVDYFPCRVKGQDGNQEFFAHARRS